MMASVTAMSAAACLRMVRMPVPCVIHHMLALEIYTLGGYIRRMRKDIKTSLQKRLGRIEGQVRGLSKMVDDDRYCIDIVTQISAVRAALRRVEEEVLRDHVAHCVEHAIASGNKADQREKITELMAVIGRSDR
jgi:CsoR family transcriptional regulator, copper-sensing transcriptional repressor